MKKFLPTSTSFSINKSKGFTRTNFGKQNLRGFTLVELLVVVAIIAILAVIGFAVFAGLTSRGNDARRRADLKSISDAMEVAKQNFATYQSIVATGFTGGVPPQDPSRTGVLNRPKYCYTDGTLVISNPGTWTTTDCPTTGAGNGTGWMVVSNTQVPTVSANATFFRVCGMTDDLVTTPAVICFGSRQ